MLILWNKIHRCLKTIADFRKRLLKYHMFVNKCSFWNICILLNVFSPNVLINICLNVFLISTWIWRQFTSMHLNYLRVWEHEKNVTPNKRCWTMNWKLIMLIVLEICKSRMRLSPWIWYKNINCCSDKSFIVSFFFSFYIKLFILVLFLLQLIKK